MKGIAFLSLLLATPALFGGIETKAQILKRIQFAKEKSSASVKRNTGVYGMNYVVKAGSGQKLILNLSPAARVGIKVESKGAYGEIVLLREERGGTFEIGLEESGDYTIFIGSTNNKPVPFTLTVKIAKMTDI